jgi:hypothetical protein
MGIELLPTNILRDFEVAERYHACSILKTDFPEEWDDLVRGLSELKLPRSQILAGVPHLFLLLE